jgi:hypothetical protein
MLRTLTHFSVSSLAFDESSAYMWGELHELREGSMTPPGLERSTS